MTDEPYLLDICNKLKANKKLNEYNINLYSGLGKTKSGAKIVDEVEDFPRLVTRIGISSRCCIEISKAEHFEKGTNEFDIRCISSQDGNVLRSGRAVF